MARPLQVLSAGLSPQDCSAMQRQLAAEGFRTVSEAVDDLDGLTAALDRQPWDVLVLADQAPRFDATAALGAVQARDLQLPCIVLAAATDDARARAVLLAGAHDYLAPDSLGRLAAVVQREQRRAGRHAHECEQQASLRGLIDTWPDGLLVVDIHGVIRLANPAALTIMRAQPHDNLIGATLQRVIAPARHDHILAYLDGVVTGANPAIRIETMLSALDGQLVPVEVSAAHTLWHGQPAAQLVIRDASSHGYGARRVSRTTGDAELLSRLAARLNATTELSHIYAVVCEEAAAGLGLPLAFVTLYDGQRDAFAYASDHGLPREARERLRPLPRTVYDAHADASGAVIVFPDAASRTALPNAPLFAELGVRVLAHAGMVREGHVLGLLSVAILEDGRAFDEAELVLLQGLAAQAAQAITSAQLAREARRRLTYLQARRTIEMATSASLDLRLTLNVILDQVVRQLHVDAADVLLFNATAQRLEYAGGLGFRLATPQRLILRLGEGHAGRVALEQEPIGLPNLRGAVRDFVPDQQRLIAMEHFVAYHAWPLIAKGQVKGVLEIYHRAPLNPDVEWIGFMEALATQAAIAIDNAALFNDLQRTNTELALAYDATIEGWARTLELRDHVTEGHTRRVTDLTLRLGRLLGISKSDLAHMRRGAILHDIGKMAIPDRILRKPGPLSEEEWAIMRMHPVYAYELLSPITFLRTALDIPYCHHEKWDGTGYPQGLKGRQIPLAARIFAAVDVWDALRSDRPYRAGWSEERVSQYVESLAGTHLDPEVVAIFLDMIHRPHGVTGATDALRAV